MEKYGKYRQNGWFNVIYDDLIWFGDTMTWETSIETSIFVIFPLQPPFSAIAGSVGTKEVAAEDPVAHGKSRVSTSHLHLTLDCWMDSIGKS